MAAPILIGKNRLSPSLIATYSHRWRGPHTACKYATHGTKRWDRYPDWWFNPNMTAWWNDEGSKINMDMRFHDRDGWPEIIQVPVFNDCRLRATGQICLVAVSNSPFTFHLINS